MVEEAPLAPVKAANEWWRSLPDCVKVALFEDYWDLKEHDGETRAEEPMQRLQCLNFIVIPGSRVGEKIY